VTLVIRTTGLEDYLDGGEGRIKALIMGSPGSGKTRSSSFWPKPLLADCEEGRMSVADRRIPYAAITSPADMKALLDMAEAEAKKPKDQRRFETLVVDTLDAYQRIVIQDYLRRAKKPSMSGWQDWGHLEAEMNELVSRLNGLPMNVVINLHVKDTKVGGDDDGDGGYLVKSPKLKGDLKDQIAAEFDLVGFMEAGWEAIDGKRALARYIQWEPSPDKPILKDRSGRLPKRTPVTFSERDYLGLLEPLRAAQQALTASSVVDTLETEEAVEPEPVAKGGPVGTGVAKTATAKKTAAKKAAAPATPVATPPATPPAAAPVPAARKPEPHEDPVSEGQAVHNVRSILGGKVIDPETNEPVLEHTPGQPDSCPVCRPGRCAMAPQDTPDGSQVLEFEAEAPAPTSLAIACGSPRAEGATPIAQGCGTELLLEFTDDRVTGCTSPEGQMPDLIQIAGMKTRAFLCNPCYANYRNASKKN
jgi:hypothetical protein